MIICFLYHCSYGVSPGLLRQTETCQCKNDKRTQNTHSPSGKHSDTTLSTIEEKKNEIQVVTPSCVGYTPTMLTHKRHLKYKGRHSTNTATRQSGFTPTFKTTVVQQLGTLFLFLIYQVTETRRPTRKP